MKARNAKPEPIHPRALLLNNESRIAYNKLADEYMDLYKPANRAELDLVNDIISTRWRLNRIVTLEAASIDLTVDRQRQAVDKEIQNPDEATRTAAALAELAHNNAISIFGRHEARLRRTFERSVRELARLRKQNSSTSIPTNA